MCTASTACWNSEHGLLEELADGLWGLDYTEMHRDDARRARIQDALVRYPLARDVATPKEAGGVLTRYILRYSGFTELAMTYHSDYGVTGLTVWWTGGPSWRAMRALVDNFAAVRPVGLYPRRVVPEACPLVDYILCTRESYHEYDNRRAETIAWFHRTFCIGPV